MTPFKYEIAYGEPYTDPVLNFTFRNCTKGQELVNGICVDCIVGYFNVEANSECQICPANANCLGTDKLIADVGYWRSSEFSSGVYRCLANGACKGGLEGWLCETGYEGLLCHECVGPLDD